MAYKKIIVGTDGSKAADAAHQVAAAIAKASRAQLTVVHGCAHLPEGEEVVARAKRSLADAGVTPATELHEGDPVEVIIEIADRKDAGLIVLGSRGLGRAKRFFMGSVSHSVSYHAPCDVLIVREHTLHARHVPYKNILVATDGSPTADRAARKGLDLARALDASATLLFIGHPNTGDLVLKDTVATLAGDMEVKTRVLGGDPAERIVEAADAERTDLIVVGNKGVTGAARFLLGSVPLKVLQSAQCDVLIARTVTQATTEIGKGEGGIVAVDGAKVAVYRDDDGEVHALSAKCTHMGCTVKWNSADRTWDCPCHGSRYSTTGEVVNGPAAKPLAPTVL